MSNATLDPTTPTAPATAQLAPDAHVLTIINPAEDDWTLTCPFDPETTGRRCAVIQPCDCVEPEPFSSCPENPDAGQHEWSRNGSSGVRDHGCWLLESDDTCEAVADLNLPVGRYLVREIGNDEIPELEVLGAAPPA